MRTATTANEMARSVWPAATRARADKPNTAISTRNLPVSVSRDADFGATSFHQTEDGRARRQGTDDDPFRQIVARVDAPVHEGQQSAQFEEGTAPLSSAQSRPSSKSATENTALPAN